MRGKAVDDSLPPTPTVRFSLSLAVGVRAPPVAPFVTIGPMREPNPRDNLP